MNLAATSRVAISYPGLTDLTSNFTTVGDSSCATSVQKKSSTENWGKTSQEKRSRLFMLRGTQQVFRLFQSAIQLSQRELPLQRDSSQSLQAHWWELELSQE
jgi:hypothetical protein